MTYSCFSSHTCHTCMPFVCSGRPILRVPNLCIHLQTSSERASFAPNKETHLSPVMAMTEGTEACWEDGVAQRNDSASLPCRPPLKTDQIVCGCVHGAACGVYYVDLSVSRFQQVLPRV